MTAEREDAQRRRAEARRGRRDAAEQQDGAGEVGEQTEEPSDRAPADADSHETLKHAALVAAAGAAVGAAVGAARALTTRDDRAENGDDAGGRTEADAQSRAEDVETDERPEPAGPAGDGRDDFEPESRDRPPDQEPDQEEDEEPAGAGTSTDADGDADLPARDELPSGREAPPSEGERAGRVEGARVAETADVVGRAREYLQALHRREPESLSSLERTPDGWTATFEFLELARIPESTDVMASYEVVLDEHKNVTRYGRVHRYYRAQADRDEGS